MSAEMWRDAPLSSRRFARLGPLAAVASVVLAAHAANAAPSAVAEPAAPVSVSGAYLQAQFALDRGDLPRAAEGFAAALKAAPDAEALKQQVFALRLASGDIEAARALARTLVAEGEVMPEARLLLAIERLKAGEPAAGATQIEAMDGEVARLVRPLLLAWTDYAKGDVGAALASLNDADADDGLAPVRAYHAAAIEALSGDPAAGRTRLEDQVDGDQPAPVRLVLALAAMRAQTGDSDAARGLIENQMMLLGENDVYAQALERLNGDGKLPLPIEDAQGGVSDALLTLARALDDQGVDWQALLLGRLAAHATPNDEDVWLFLGQNALENERSEAAIAALGNVDLDGPLGWRAGLLRAQALADLDQSDEAVAILDRMSASRPERTEALVAKGDLLRGEERWGEAEAAYTEALNRIDELRPDDWRLLYTRGITFERTDRWDKAEADFLEALDLEPEQPFVLNYLGYSWVDKGLNLERALDMLKRAVALRPDDGFIIDSLGWAHYRLGRYGEAVEELERAIEREPGDPVLNDHLGDAYWRVGRLREARYQWERALIFDPEPEEAAEIKAKLADGLAPAGTGGEPAPAGTEEPAPAETKDL